MALYVKPDAYGGIMFCFRNMRKTNKPRRITDNLIFRKYKCGLTKEETAKLCFKTVRTITEWDRGRPIPPECKRLMRLYSGRSLDPLNVEWHGWRIKHNELITPNGWTLTPDRIIAGNALIEINSDDDRKNKATLLKASRMIQKIRYR